MFDFGFGELLLIGIVALIVIGPKDLPGMFKQVGKFTARARQMAREFSQAMNAAADDSGVAIAHQQIGLRLTLEDRGIASR